MARDFNGSTDRIDYGNAYDPNTAGTAVTIAGWVYPDSITSDQYFLAIQRNSGANRGLTSQMSSGSGNGALTTYRDWTSSFAERERWGTNAFTVGSWQHFLIESDSGGHGSGMECWVNNIIPGSTGASEGSGSLEAADEAYVVGGRTADNNRNLKGRLAEIGLWSRLMTADEKGSLEKGFSPLFFRRGLEYYTKLHGPSICLVSGKTPTFDGTTVIEHPRILYPS